MSSYRKRAGERESQKKTHHFLNLALLERREFTSSSLHVKLTRASILQTRDTRTRSQGRKFPRVDLLEDFGSARIASVGVDLEEGLHFRNSSHDSSYGDEFTEVGSPNFSDGEDGIGGKRSKVEVAVTGKAKRNGALVFSFLPAFVSGRRTTYYLRRRLGGKTGCPSSSLAAFFSFLWN